MATAYGPSIVRDGLVLNIDAANSKSLLASVEVLVVAGGGSGGNFHGGGGGAGGLIYNSAFLVTAGTSTTVTVGAGGAAVTVTRGINGGNSQFGALTAIGGGGGGNEQTSQTGVVGGSGGGGSYVGSGGAGTAGQGFAGGTAVSSTAAYAAAGGGGAGGVGGNPPNFSQGGAGGVGLQFSISGTPAFYAAGGGGSVYNAAGVGIGGSGIGGNGGSFSPASAATNGATNTGSGGGGGERASGANNSGAGGSGIVIVRYFGPARATGGTITYVGGYTIHSFTTVGSSTFTPNATWSDMSGNNYNANLSPTASPPTYTSGYFTYNGTANESLIANPGALTRFTVAVWAYPSSWTGEGCLISDTYPGTTALINYCIIGAGSWRGGIYQSGWYYSPIMAWDLNTWQQVVYTFDGTNQTIYKNGVSGGSTTTYTGTPGNSTAGIKIGRRWDIADFWGGRVSNITIYNRALSAAEVNQNFQTMRGRYGI